MVQMADQAADAGTGLEAGEEQLVADYDTQSDQRDPKGVVVQQGYADQRAAEEDELDRDAEHGRRRTGGGARRGYQREHAT